MEVADEKYRYGFIGAKPETHVFTAGVGKTCGRIVHGDFCTGILYGYKTIKKRRVQEANLCKPVKHGRHGIPLRQYRIKTVQLLKCDCCGFVVQV